MFYSYEYTYDGGDPSVVDPWADVVYVADAEGNSAGHADVTTGLNPVALRGRAWCSMLSVAESCVRLGTRSEHATSLLAALAAHTPMQIL